MKPFYVSTTKFAKDGLPIFNRKGLTLAQKRFIDGCLKSFAKSITEGHLPSKGRRMSVIYWLHEEDFCGLLNDVKEDVDLELALIEFETMYENALDQLELTA